MSKTAAEKLKEAMTPGRVYRRRELKSLSNNISRDLDKLVEKNELVRAAPGLYYRPEIGKFGARPAAVKELVRAFLNEENFLLTSLSNYNPLGLGLTQLYNQTIVYNRKRHGEFVLDRVRFAFRRPRNFPKILSKEFLYVDVFNNRHELAEDTTKLESLLSSRAEEADRKVLLDMARNYGKVSTVKFFEELLAA